MKSPTLVPCLFLACSALASGQMLPASDLFTDGGSEIRITFLGHSTLMIHYAGTVIHIDPVSEYGDYRKLPKADIILITHEHTDHFDPQAINLIIKPDTAFVSNEAVQKKHGSGKSLKNGDSVTERGILIQAVPAYNTSPGRDRFHPKGRDNGYILTLGKTRVYISGDTEDIPEMARLGNIDIAFLSMNQPYTMTPQQAARAAQVIKPKVLYPYHYGETDPSLLVNLLKGSGIDVRVRDLR